MEPQTVRLAEPAPHTLYELVTVAGAGGMGTVYRARDSDTGAIVAVKLLGKDGDSVRFALEISALARLEHPNIVKYLGHGITDDGRQFLAMEWLEGASLDETLRARSLPLRRTLEIARDVAVGLAYAHAAGVVHRDLKPSNIFVTEAGAKILDFGVARITGEVGLTKTGQVIGTPSYMPPEQARGERTADPRSDLFSLGCVIHRCIAGEAPFAGPDVLSVLNKLATHTPPRLTGVPSALADLVASLLEKNMEARPRSARDVERSLERLLETDLVADEPTPSATDGPTLHSASTHERPRRKRALAILALALAGAGGAYVVHARGRSASTTWVANGAADRACRTWVAELARRQRSDGSFTGESHRESTGWDTGQELTALVRGSSCATVAPAAISSGAAALLELRVDGGWRGPARYGEPPSIAADAWAALAFASVARKDDRSREAALAARSLLLAMQRADGSFGYVSRDEPPSAYATMLGAWALLVGETLDGDARVHAARTSAFESLRALFRASPAVVRDLAGFEEQTLWVLLEARRDGGDKAGDDVLQTGARDLVQRCGLDRKTHACTRPLYEDSEVKLSAGPEAGAIVALWHPWVTAAAARLARSDVELAPDLRADLDAIARWGIAMIEPSIDALAQLPEYRLAEYLLATSDLASLR